ncbi:MAG: hypothetical protein K8R76_01315 [Candidatus Aegiribacteria sp.]|nr:hypothetical protein [Candidatus Aegiribacteria sp.]
MKKIMLFSITVFMLSVLATCGSDSTGPEPQSENWMPLSVGNSWNSTIEGYSIDPAGPDTFDLSGSVERTVTALLDHQGGFQVYEFEMLTEMTFTNPDTSYAVAESLYIYLRNTGDEMREYQDTVSTDYLIIALFPLTLNETWPASPVSSTIYEVISLNGSVTVPAGSFANCGIIRETDLNTPDFLCDRYFHRDLGIVRDSLVHGELQEIIFDLESFNVLYDP